MAAELNDFIFANVAFFRDGTSFQDAIIRMGDRSVDTQQRIAESKTPSPAGGKICSGMKMKIAIVGKDADGNFK